MRTIISIVILTSEVPIILKKKIRIYFIFLPINSFLARSASHFNSPFA